MNWRAKLSSRKFWAGIVGFITPILVLLNMPENDIVTVTSLVTSSGALIAYILSEGYVDSKKQEDCSDKGEENE